MDTGAVQSSASQFMGKMPADPHARLKKAAEGFEAQWFQQVMSEAKSAHGSKDSFATQTFQGMMNETTARSMAESHTLGLADMIVRQLQSHVTESTTPGTDAASAKPTATTETSTAESETQL